MGNLSATNSVDILNITAENGVVYSIVDIFNDDDPTITYDDDDSLELDEGEYTRKQWKTNFIMKKDAMLSQYSYPRNVSGYYRGNWSRHPIKSVTEDKNETSANPNDAIDRRNLGGRSTSETANNNNGVYTYLTAEEGKFDMQLKMSDLPGYTIQMDTR